MLNQRYLNVLILLLCVLLFLGVGCNSNAVCNYDAPEVLRELEVVGEKKIIESGSNEVDGKINLRGFICAEFSGIDENINRLEGATTLSYKIAQYLFGEIEYVAYKVIRNLDKETPDIYIVISKNEDLTEPTQVSIINYTEKKVWDKLAGDENFILLAEGDNVMFYYDLVYSREKLYMDAIAQWDGKSPLYTEGVMEGANVSPPELIYEIRINEDLDDALFSPPVDSQ